MDNDVDEFAVALIGVSLGEVGIQTMRETESERAGWGHLRPTLNFAAVPSLGECGAGERQ